MVTATSPRASTQVARVAGVCGPLISTMSRPLLPSVRPVKPKGDPVTLRIQERPARAVHEGRDGRRAAVEVDDPGVRITHEQSEARAVPGLAEGSLGELQIVGVHGAADHDARQGGGRDGPASGLERLSTLPVRTTAPKVRVGRRTRAKVRVRLMARGVEAGLTAPSDETLDSLSGPAGLPGECRPPQAATSPELDPPPDARTMRTRFLLALTPLLAIASAPALAAPLQGRAPDVNAYPRQASFPEVLRDCSVGAPEELFDVLRVIDGDTLWIEREGQREKLRLLSVDTEEKFMERELSPSKPSTRYGDLVTGWTQGFFTPRTPEEGGPRRAALPGRRRAAGRLRPAALPRRHGGGRGLQPAPRAHGAEPLLQQVRPQPPRSRALRGVPGEGHGREARRVERRHQQEREEAPYARLLPWWEARGAAVHAFRELSAADPAHWVAADEPEALEMSMKAAPGEEVTLLCSVDRFFDEDDGSRTVLLRGGDKKRSVRVRIEPEALEAMAKVDLEGSKEDFRQNYLTVKGTLAIGKRGFDLVGVEPGDWRRAGPEPVFK